MFSDNRITKQQCAMWDFSRVISYKQFSIVGSKNNNVIRVCGREIREKCFRSLSKALDFVDNYWKEKGEK